MFDEPVVEAEVLILKFVIHNLISMAMDKASPKLAACLILSCLVEACLCVFASCYFITSSTYTFSTRPLSVACCVDQLSETQPEVHKYSMGASPI